VVAARAATEVCGLAPAGPGFLATAGTGEVIGPAGTASKSDDAWDNHVQRLG
jgi:hypothetical protein